MKSLACTLLGFVLFAGTPALAQLRVPGQKPAPAKPASGKAAAEPNAGEQRGDPLGEYIQASFKRFGGWTLCIVEDTPVAEIRAEVVAELKRRGVADSASPQEVDVALATRYPCPFSPYRDELKPASPKDVEGVWLFPEASQPYRYGPRSPDRPATPAVAARCELVGFYPGGEHRTGLVRGEDACPFTKAADLEPARAGPRLLSWSMPAEGRIRITRNDMPEFVQEWEVFVVTAAFGMHAMDFAPGDLVAFLRKERGNDINAATEFRHLQRLR